MKSRPILFSGPMVRALLAGTKTQTRRIVKPQPVKSSGTHRGYPLALMANDWAWPHPRISSATTISNRPNGPLGWEIHCPYGQPGDRLWVRETHSIHHTHGQHRTDGLRWGPWDGLPTTVSPDGTQIAYYRDRFDRCDPGRWRPSIHMPRWASRLTLEITGVRVERLQDISEADAVAEGISYSKDFEGFHTEECRHYHGRDPRKSYEKLWEAINGPGSWDANPWVWVLSFRRLEP